MTAQSLAALLWALSTNLEQSQKTQDLFESISNICDATRWKDVESEGGYVWFLMFLFRFEVTIQRMAGQKVCFRKSISLPEGGWRFAIYKLHPFRIERYLLKGGHTVDGQNPAPPCKTINFKDSWPIPLPIFNVVFGILSGF